MSSRIFLSVTILFLTAACQVKETTLQPVASGAPPAWIMQGNVYEVNVRQFTPEGTLDSFGKHLDRLKEMGVQTLWFMPLNPISKKERKGTLGSYYAVANFTTLNPEFGTMNDWKELVSEIHKRDMKVIIDWVPNHTGADHSWITSHPEFYVQDSTDKPAVAFDWDDVRQLDYKNTIMQDSMINAMKYWLTNTNIDGFRVDVAWNVSADFWKKCIPQLRSMKENLFMLAEGDKAYLSRSGFDAVYPWSMFHMMKKVAKGERTPMVLDSIKAVNDTLYAPGTIQLYFTSNHDENSWNKSDFETFPGASHAPFAVFTQTMANSVPLIYSGQEEPVLRALEFFEKDPIGFEKYQRTKFYKTLLGLRAKNPALAADAAFTKVSVGDDKSIYAFVRQKGDAKILVILNFSPDEQEIKVTDASLQGNPYNVFMYTREPLTDQPWKIEPWGYVIYEY
jgi:alpha-amylase